MPQGKKINLGVFIFNSLMTALVFPAIVLFAAGTWWGSLEQSGQLEHLNPGVTIHFDRRDL